MQASVRLGFVVRRGVFIVLLLGLAGGIVALVATLAHARVGVVAQTRTTPVYAPPVLAGQFLGSGCTGGVYARTADSRVVLTTTGHCLSEGATAVAIDGTPLGRASAWSHLAVCDKPGKDRCTASDMATITLRPAMIPWGHLDQIDLGPGGYTTVARGSRALACPDIRAGDEVAVNGRGGFRTGRVVAQEVYNFDGDGTYFPCMVITDVPAMSGDSGGVVLVGGVPAGVAAREFGADNLLGFTPLGPGLVELGLTLCDSPNCDLTPANVGNR